MQTQAQLLRITASLSLKRKHHVFAGCYLAYGSANSVSFTISRELQFSLIPTRLDTNEQVTTALHQAGPLVHDTCVVSCPLYLSGSIHLHLSGHARSVQQTSTQVVALKPSSSCAFAAQVWMPPAGPVCSLLIVRCVRLPQARES